MLAQWLCYSFQTKELDKCDSFIVFLETFKAKLVELSSYELKTVFICMKINTHRGHLWHYGAQTQTLIKSLQY